jgi:hypothetical protein
MSTAQNPPKVFISYSWSGAEHEQFVMELATALKSHGVDAILDKWRLKPGQDKHVFMESMVSDPSMGKVLLMCDRAYKEKADSRRGGVGTESQIISSELYSKVDQTKFIPVLCEPGGEDLLPVFMKSRMYVDVSSPEKYGAGLDELLRQIYDQPLYPEPAVGARPSFLNPASPGLAMAKELASALRAIKDGKETRTGLEHLFVKSVVAEVRRSFVKPEPQSGYDEEIYQAIVKTKGLRDQLSEYADVVASFSSDDPQSLKPYISMLESLGQMFGPVLEDGAYVETWTDLYRFFALEAVLIMTAALLRHECWRSLRHLLKYPYVVRTDHREARTERIVIFDSYIESIDEHRNNRLNTNRLSVTADLLKERCSPDFTPFSELVQADLFLALYAVAHAHEWRASPQYSQWHWTPRTAVYLRDISVKTMPVFLKFVDADYRASVRGALDVRDGADLAARVEAARLLMDGFKLLSVDRWGRFDLETAVNLTALKSL